MRAWRAAMSLPLLQSLVRGLFVHGVAVRVADGVRALSSSLQLPGELRICLAFLVDPLELFREARIALVLELLGREADPGLVGV